MTTENNGCLAGVGKGFNFTEREEAMQREIAKLRVQAHCTHESAELQADVCDEDTYLCPDCDYQWSESK